MSMKRLLALLRANRAALCLLQPAKFFCVVIQYFSRVPDDTFVVGSKAGVVHLAMARPVELGLDFLGALM